MLKRLGYYVVKGDGTLDVNILAKPVDDEVLAEAHALTSIVFALQPITFAFQAVQRNYDELTLSVADVQARSNAAGARAAAPIELAVEGYICATQRLNNFLASAGAYLTLAKRLIASIPGAHPDEAVLWNEKRKELHAKLFAYRFMYELRNFSQHYSLPFSAFNLAGTRSDEAADLSFTASLMMSRDELLASGYSWKKLKAELHAQPESFDLMPLAAEYMSALRDLCLMAFDLNEQRLLECARYLAVVRSKLLAPPEAELALFFGASSAGAPPRRHETLPTRQLDMLFATFNRLKHEDNHAAGARR